MRKRRFHFRRMWLIVPFFLALAMLMSGNVGAAVAEHPVAPSTYQAPKAPFQDDDDPVVIRVGAYILNVGNLDVTSGTYSIDFYLTFKCNTPCNPGTFDLMNSVSFDAEDQTGDYHGGTFYSYRVKAELMTNLNLVDYPFDEHQLIIVVEDKNYSVKELVYVYDPALSGIDSSARTAGWALRPEFSGDVVDHDYAIFEDAWSRFNFYVTIYHDWWPSFLKGLFAAIVIVGVGMLSFLMPYNDTEDRLDLAAGTLASAIFYHLTLTSSIPPVGYLTFADKFMMLQYVFIFITLGISVALFILVGKGRENETIAKRLHQATRVTIPLLWVIAMVVLQLTSFTI